MIKDAMLPEGHRLACTFMSEVSPSSTFAIRKFPQKPWTIAKLLQNNTLTSEIASWLWLLIENRLATLVAGEMGSGKTSLANALCGLCPPTSMVGTAEDIPEFKIPHKHWRRHYTRSSMTIEGKGTVLQKDIVVQLLRENVDYVIVNEVLGEEDASAWIKAVETGHGGITTVHTESTDTLLPRLTDLGIRPASLSSVHAVVFISQFTTEEGALKRKIRRIVEVDDISVEKDRIEFTKLFSYSPAAGEYEFVGIERALKTKSAQIILGKKGLKEEELRLDYQNRVEFLEWLRKMALSRPEFLEMERLTDEFSFFYNDPHYYKSIEPGDPTKINTSPQKSPGFGLPPRSPAVRVLEVKEVPYMEIKIVSIADLKKKEIRIIR